MATPRSSSPTSSFSYPRLRGIMEAAAFLGVLFTAASFAGRQVWFCEIFTHFKLQLAVCFLGYAILEWAAKRRRSALLSMGLACVNAWPVLLLFLPAPSGAGVPPAPAARVRILQANILTSNTRAADLLALVDREQPDVIVLQEPNARWLRDLAPLKKAYPRSAALPREDNFGAAIYCRSNALSADVFQLSDPEGAPSTLARITADGRTLTIVGTHPLAPCDAAMWKGRNAYVLELAGVLRQIRGPLVVTGDFNNTPWTGTFQTFLQASGLRDSAQGRGPLPTWPADNPLLRIPLDQCLYNDEVRILSKRLGPNIGSDHLPLIIDASF